MTAPLKVRLIGDRVQVDQVITSLVEAGGTWNGRHYSARGGRGEVRAYVEVPPDDEGRVSE